MHFMYSYHLIGISQISWWGGLDRGIQCVFQFLDFFWLTLIVRRISFITIHQPSNSTCFANFSLARNDKWGWKIPKFDIVTDKSRFISNGTGNAPKTPWYRFNEGHRSQMAISLLYYFDQLFMACDMWPLVFTGRGVHCMLWPVTWKKMCSPR